MNMEKLKFTGVVTIRRYNEKTEETLEERVIKNLVVSAGLAWIIARMAGAPAVMSHMAVGTNAVAAADANTALGAELTRVALTSATPSGAKITYIASYPAGVGTGALTEAGILNAATGGTLLARTVFPVVNKGANDAISITWAITAAKV